MPTFDFQCQDCNHVFEFSRPFGSTEIPPCAACKSPNVIKLFAPPNIQFKGSGFYKNDSSEQAKLREEPKQEKSPTKKESTESKQ